MRVLRVHVVTQIVLSNSCRPSHFFDGLVSDVRCAGRAAPSLKLIRLKSSKGLLDGTIIDLRQLVVVFQTLLFNSLEGSRKLELSASCKPHSPTPVFYCL
jgi:hypothetical protein